VNGKVPRVVITVRSRREFELLSSIAPDSRCKQSIAVPVPDPLALR
jgi:hypothetical protein